MTKTNKQKIHWQNGCANVWCLDQKSNVFSASYNFLWILSKTVGDSRVNLVDKQGKNQHEWRHELDIGVNYVRLSRENYSSGKCIHTEILKKAMTE